MDDDSERLFEQVGYRGVAELATWQRAWLDEDAGGKFVRDREAYKKFFAWSLMQKCLEAVVNPNG
jgi:hypothetical protein